MSKVDSQEIYNQVKYGRVKFEEEKHCKLILDVMTDLKKGTHSAFCIEAKIGEGKFYLWLKNSEIFQECYAIGRMFAREAWERLGFEVKDEVTMPGTSNYKFEHWKMIGWSRFGVSKNSRIRLDLNPNDTPDKHYSQLLAQAKNGDFTSGEIKQLMEAINVGLSTHQVIKLQKELDELRSDLATMKENSDGHNTITDTRIT